MRALLRALLEGLLSQDASASGHQPLVLKLIFSVVLKSPFTTNEVPIEGPIGGPHWRAQLEGPVGGPNWRALLEGPIEGPI